MAKIAGTLYVSVDGSLIPVGGKWEVGEGGVKREPKTGLDGVTHFVETPVPAYFDGECNTSLTQAQVDKLKSLADGQVTGEFANGRVVTLDHAFCEGDLKSDMVGGTMPVKFYMGGPG